MKPSGRVTQKHIDIPGFRSGNASCPLFQLFNSTRAECIRRRHHDLLPLAFQQGCHFAHRCSLAYTIDADDQHNALFIFKIICLFTQLHLLLNGINENLPALFRLFDLLFFYFLFQIFNDAHGRINSHVAHDHDLFQFFIKIIVNAGKPFKNRVKA